MTDAEVNPIVLEEEIPALTKTIESFDSLLERWRSESDIYFSFLKWMEMDKKRTYDDLE